MKDICKELAAELEQRNLKYEITAELGAKTATDKEFKLLLEERTQSDVLAVEVRTIYRVLLSCGGPTRYLDITYNADGDAVSAIYFDSTCEVREIALSDAEVETIAERYDALHPGEYCKN